MSYLLTNRMHSGMRIFEGKFGYRIYNLSFLPPLPCLRLQLMKIPLLMSTRYALFKAHQNGLFVGTTGCESAPSRKRQNVTVAQSQCKRNVRTYIE